MEPYDVIMVGAGSAGAVAVGKLSEDPRGVVNPDLSEKGIAGLRVADASIMPADCRANTHFTCVMIGLRPGLISQQPRRERHD